jgi:hypothetical protein
MQIAKVTARETGVRPLWQLYRNGHDAVCEITVSAWGFEGRFLVDGRFLYSHTFARPDQAIEWARQREKQCRRQGWMPWA